MTQQRLWMFVTFAGVLLFVGGLIATIALAIETGERVPDSECSSMAPASVFAACFTSDDPKMLLGIVPLMLGIGVAGVGIWRWIVAASNEAAVAGPDGGGGTGGGLFGTIRNLQQQAEQMAANAGTMAAGSTPPPAPPSPPPPDEGS